MSQFEMNALAKPVNLEIKGSPSAYGKLLQQLGQLLLEGGIKEPDPPCKGAVIVSSSTYWHCDLVYWSLRQDTVWKCPDGRVLKRTDTIRETNDECGDD